MSGISSTMTEMEQREARKKKEEEFRNNLPCKKCKLAEMCKYVDTIPYVELPEFLSIEISCKYHV